MKKLIIKSQKNGEMTRNFESEKDIQDFIEVSGDHYGKVAYTETIPEAKDADGNVIQPEQVINHEATVSFEIVDITAEANKEKLIEKNLARMQFGQQIMAELAAMNQSALETKQTNVTNILAAEEKLAKVQRLLLNGSLGLAYQILGSLDVPELGTQLKTYFLNKIKTYLDSE